MVFCRLLAERTIRHDRIALVRQIGQGNFGKVFKGECGITSTHAKSRPQARFSKRGFSVFPEAK